MVMKWLVEFIGLKAMAKWSVRLLLLVLLLAVPVVLYLYGGRRLVNEAIAYTLTAALLWLIWWVFEWIRRRTRLSRWCSRGSSLALLAILLFLFSWEAFLGSTNNIEIEIGFLVLWLAWVVFDGWRNRGREAPGERTIDGKVVPEKLAVAALPIPPRSPDADYVLRGLPDYGKTLLKLDKGNFEYVPETPEPELPLEQPTVKRASRPRWVMITGLVALIFAVFVGIEVYERPKARWRLSADAAFDSQTGLTWMTGGYVQPVNWQDAKEYCERMRYELIEKRLWRLPTREELAVLWADKADPDARSLILGDRDIWTADTVTGDSGRAYMFVGSDGAIAWAKEDHHLALCVSAPAATRRTPY